MEYIPITLNGERARVMWKDNSPFIEGYDIEAERTALALTQYGEGLGVFLVCLADTCHNEEELFELVNKFKLELRQLRGRLLPGGDEFLWRGNSLLFEYFSYHPDVDWRWLGLPVEKLTSRHVERILLCGDQGLILELLRRGDLPEEYFSRFAHHPNPDFRANLAYNQRIPMAILEILTHDPEVNVRKSVGMQDRASMDIQRLLAHDDSEEVRSTILGKYDLPVEFQRIVLRKGRYSQKMRLAQMTDSLPILEGLSKDIEPTIRDEAQANEVYRKAHPKKQKSEVGMEL